MNEGKGKRVILIIAAILTAILIAFIVLYVTVLKDEFSYQKALKLANRGGYTNSLKAYRRFASLADYKEAKEYLPGLNEILLQEAKVGDTVFFGTYEQDAEEENGKETIEWYVLAKEDDRLLLVSRYALDSGIPYHDASEDVTWETCTLRQWLNETFLNDAFSLQEQAMIPEVQVSAEQNPNYDTDPGNDTYDKVFLLSVMEVQRYFTFDEVQKISSTDYARFKKGNNYTDCWLRSLGESNQYAAYCGYYGNGFVIDDYNVDDQGFDIRPSVWINLE